MKKSILGQTVSAPATREEADAGEAAQAQSKRATPAVEIGGRKGPEPTRYGDWEKNGRCIDF